MRRTAPVALLGVVLAVVSTPAQGEPLSEVSVKFIEGRMLRAKLMSNPGAALDYCREADRRAALYDRDPFYDGAIARCVAYAEVHLKNESAACEQRARALERLQSVPAGHPKHAEASELAASIRRDDGLFRC
jgi:hypothetical protein